VQRELRLLRELEHALVLRENALAETSDPWSRKQLEEPFVCLGEEDYYLPTSQTATEGIVASGLRTGVAWRGLPAVVTTPPAAGGGSTVTAGRAHNGPHADIG